MANNLRGACDGILQKVVTGEPRVPGVVGMVTGRSASIYEGAAGEHLTGGHAMTTDTVFAIFSTTKAITGTAILQCVEEGKLDLDAAAKTYVPDIGKLEVLEGFDASGNPKLRAPKRDITTRMLMLHTAGLGYDFFNANYFRLAQEARAAERGDVLEGFIDDTAPVRSRREMGIRQQHRLVRPDRREHPR